MSAPDTDAAHQRRLRELRAKALKRYVTRRVSRGFNGNWTRRDWAHAGLFASILALLGTLVPGLDQALTAPGHAPRASLALPLPHIGPLHAPAADSRKGDSWHIINVREGETASAIFEQLEIPKADLARLLKYPGVNMEMRRLRPGAELAFDLPPGGALRAFRYTRLGEKVELDLTGDVIKETPVPQQVDVRTVVLTGKVGDSLFKSARKVGLTQQNLKELTDDIFKYDIDFRSDLDADDRFSVVVDQTWKDGKLVKTGPVLAATITADGKLYSGFLFERNGKRSYFTADGRSLERPFIRMPIPYARLTSGFGGRRHPVLGSMRMHKGVDYAARTGTPIMAAGDARVKSVGWHGGYGRAVELDHGQGRTTFYAHMSRFGNIRVGQRINQGTVIGYVGSTGMSTGPHLHYEFRVNGVHRNPLSMTLPPPAPLTGALLAEFKGETRRALAKIREVENIVFQGEDDPRLADAASADKTGGKRG
ncbi:peptidoglycan DD-metalloendopeptidase family protein [Luteimonas sp. e5]